MLRNSSSHGSERKKMSFLRSSIEVKGGSEIGMPKSVVILREGPANGCLSTDCITERAPERRPLGAADFCN